MAIYPETFAHLMAMINRERQQRQRGGPSILNHGMTKGQALDILEAAIGGRVGVITSDKRDAMLKRNIIRECGRHI